MFSKFQRPKCSSISGFGYLPKKRPVQIDSSPTEKRKRAPVGAGGSAQAQGEMSNTIRP